MIAKLTRKLSRDVMKYILTFLKPKLIFKCVGHDQYQYITCKECKKS
jgi:hypothetical protein